MSMRQFHENQLESAYGVDRAVGHLLDIVPDNTIVIYMSDNGFLWGEHNWFGKNVPYNESVRVPIIYKDLSGGSYPIAFGTNDIVLNIDLLPTLETLAGLTPPSVDGVSWTDSSATRQFLPIHHPSETDDAFPGYCGVRSTGWMFAHYVTGEEEMYNEQVDPYELHNLADDPTYQGMHDQLLAKTKAICGSPPGFSWGGA